MKIKVDASVSILCGKFVSLSIVTRKIDNWRSWLLSFIWEGGKRDHGITIPLSGKSVRERLNKGRQNCRGAINGESRRKKRCLPEIEILVPRRLKQQLKARYSRPSINYSKSRPGVSHGSGSPERSASNVKLDIDEVASVEMMRNRNH